jgi:2',3'-cyclic-nucleotide 2'-phosphodiesterase (5'-nucleotidase family)
MNRLLPALLLCLLVGAPAAAENPPAKLTILFTNDVHGYVEPCG